MFVRSMLLGAAVAALASAPASATVTLDPLKRCYVVAQADQREPLDIVGRGFTARSTVDVFIDDILQSSPKALYDGTVTGSLPAPFVEFGQRDFTLRLAEQDNPDNTIAQTSKVTQFSVEQVPKSARTDDRVRFTGRGFTGTGPVYAHYVFGGKSKKTVLLRVPKGACGTFSARRKQFPFAKRPKVGTWTIQFDQVPDYDPQATAKVRMTIKVKRAPKIKPKRARAR
jgi:hypothetical protein